MTSTMPISLANGGGTPSYADFEAKLAAATAQEKANPSAQNQAAVSYLETMAASPAKHPVDIASVTPSSGSPGRMLMDGGDIEMGNFGPDAAAAFAELPNYISDSGSTASVSDSGSYVSAVPIQPASLAMRAFQNAAVFTQQLGHTLVTPFLPLLQRAGILTGQQVIPFNPAAGLGAGAVGLGTGVAINQASTAAYGANPNFLYGAGAGAFTAGLLNLGYARLPGFDDAAAAAAGTLGPYSKNLGRSAANGAIGFVGGLLVNTLINYKDPIGDFFSSLVRPSNQTITAEQSAIKGRGLTETDNSQEVTDAQGIFDASSAVWQSWMANPATESEIQSLVSTPSGAAMVGQLLTSEGAGQYAQTQAQAQLAAFQKADPTGYSNYINEVTTKFGAGSGPENSYATAEQSYVTASQGLQNFMTTALSNYAAANPNASMNDFYSSLSAQEKATINGYAATMNAAQTKASTDVSLAQSDFEYYSTEQQGTQPSNQPPASTTTTPSNSSAGSPPAYTPLGAGQVIASSAATGAAAGSVAGLFGGPLAEVTVPVGAAIGGGLGAIGGAIGWAIFGG